MSHLYFSTPHTPERARKYWVSRLARVLPLFYATIMLSLLLQSGFGLSYYRIKDVLALVSNGLLFAGTGVLWSIPVEIHFYAVFAACWFLHGKVPAVWLLAGLVTLQFAGVLLLSGRIEGAAALPFWLHFFVAGAVIAQVWRRMETSARAFSARLSGKTAGWLVLFATIWSLPAAGRVPDPAALPYFLNPWHFACMVAVFAAALCALGPFRLLALPVMRWCGALSYGLYLLHMPVIHLVKMVSVRMSWPPGAGFALAVLLTLLVAQVSSHVFERPVQRVLVRRFGSADARRQPARTPAR